MFPEYTREMGEKKASLAPQNIEAWRNFSRTIFKEGALDKKTKELIAIAVAHVTQCPYCIRAHTQKALRLGISEEQIMESIWVAAEMRAGAAYAHGSLAVDEMVKFSEQNKK